MATHECIKCGKDVELACADPSDCILGNAQEARRLALKEGFSQLKIGAERAACLFAEMDSALKIVALQSDHLASLFRDAFSEVGGLEMIVVNKSRTMGMTSFADENTDLIREIEKAVEQFRKNDHSQQPSHVFGSDYGFYQELDKVHPEPVESNHAYFRRFEKRKRV